MENNSVMGIRELEDAKSGYLKEIVLLHKKAFPSFFLTQLGAPFLKALYKGYLEDKYSGIIVAEDKGRLVGFIAYSKDYSRFFRELVKHHWIRFAVCSAGAAIRHPSFIMRLFRAFGKSKSVEKKEDYVELASICVDPEIQGQGVGTMLIDHLKNMIDFETYEYISLETDADNNVRANRFYQKNGFELARRLVTAEGRRMNEYRYRGSM